MAKWFFPADMESWASGGYDHFEWTGAEGLSLGCLYGVDDGANGINNAVVSITGQNFAMAIGDNISFWVKIIEDDSGGLHSGVWTVTMQALATGSVVLAEATDTFEPDGVTLYQTNGFVKVSGVATANGTVVEVTLSVSASNADIVGFFWADNIYVAESELGAYDLTHSVGGIPGAIRVA